MRLRTDPGGGVFTSSFLKPKEVDDWECECKRCYEPHSTKFMDPMTVYDATEHHNNMAPDARALRWMYERHIAQLQHYATHLMQETGGNEDVREARPVVTKRD